MSYMSSNLPCGNLYALTFSCKFANIYLTLIPILVLCTVELLLVVRVCSLYGNGKFAIWSLRGLVAGAVIGGVVIKTLNQRQFHVTLSYKFLPGCWVSSSHSHHIREWPIWTAFLSFEGVLMLLTAYKLLSYRNQMNHTVAILARDSIIYFVLIFVSIMMYMLPSVDTSFTIGFATPMQCIASVAVGRMMMNIRGLIMEDPEHTTHLQTLQFATRINASSEIEEGTEGEA